MSAIDKIRAGADKARTKLAAQGLGGRTATVTVETYTAGNQVAGTAGTWGSSFTISPTPVTEIKAINRWNDGVMTKVGDVKVSGISRASYTETQLRGASADHPTRWTIGGRRYTVVSLEERPTEWIAILAGLEG